MIFYDRQEAGQKLAFLLKEYKNNKEAVILAIPRGGVVVGFEVAKLLKLPLDIIVSRKIGAPGNSEFAIGAVSEKGDIILNKKVISDYQISKDYINKELKLQRKEIKRRLTEYREGKKSINLRNKIIIIIDDGIATGSSIKAAISSVKTENPQKIILAIPVAPPDTISEFKKEVDQIIVIEQPEPFFAVGQFYQIFDQVTDNEVKKILKNQYKIKFK